MQKSKGSDSELGLPVAVVVAYDSHYIILLNLTFLFVYFVFILPHTNNIIKY